MLIDLQLHSTYSDGYLTPTELVKFIASQGVKVAALTDHNTVGGLSEFKIACEKQKIKPINGLELYVHLNSRRFSLLWLNFHKNNAELHDLLRKNQSRRRAAIRRILNNLKKDKFKLDIDKIIDKYNHYVPLNHVVNDFLSYPENLTRVKKKLGQSFREEEVMNKYFLSREYGPLKESTINIQAIIKLRKKIGGQLILNHPAKYNYVKNNFIQHLKKLGIDGIEVLSPHHNYGAIMYLQHIARLYGLIMTGGSDFHRYEHIKTGIKSSYDYFRISSELLPGIKKIIG